MIIAFDQIFARAVERLGEAELVRRLPEVREAAALAAWPDDRYLSQMSLRVFRAGLKHGLVDAKWPAFEEAFRGFVPAAVTLMSDDELEALMADARLIRHWGKIRSVRDNAAAMAAISREHGGFGKWLAGWPGERITELWAELGKRFAQMGGQSAPRFLRMVGKDTFILTPSVVAALKAFGVLEEEPRSHAARCELAAEFNAWAAQSGRPLAQISMILAASVPD